MAIKGQTHAKRAREFALKEKRERKKAKKDARLAGDTAEATGTTEESILQPQPEPAAEWVQ